MKKLTNKITHFNTQKGITLVALVITIIVLLILAGVAINMAINSDGLFGKANEATEKWNESVEKEETAIKDLLAELDKVSPIEVEISTDIPENWDDAKVSVVATSGNRQVPIPVGYTVSSIEGENTISGGLVIYQGTQAVTGDKNSAEHIIAMETRNQFVWIPVDDINYMVMCKSNNLNGDGTVCNIKLEENLICETHNSTDLAGRLYSTYTDISDLNGICTRKLDFTNKTQQYDTDLGYREPTNLKSTSNGDATTKGITAIKSMLQTVGKTYGDDATYDEIKEDWLKLQQDDFEKMAESVEKYGGFYISRYEVGTGGISKKSQDVLVNNSDENNWWGMYSSLRADGKTMIWGSQYDQVVKFLGTTAQVGHNDRNLAKSNPAKSGLNEFDLLNNIFDLEGNYLEWTAEGSNTDIRAHRGNDYRNANQSLFYPASSRGSFFVPTNNYSYCTTRISLYL